MPLVVDVVDVVVVVSLYRFNAGGELGDNDRARAPIDEADVDGALLNRDFSTSNAFRRVL